jgi:ElaB/YqjD/DUF883 family membrane-anchored ribosome-binding protein
MVKALNPPLPERITAMTSKRNDPRRHLEALAEDARGLLNATTSVVGDQVDEARTRLNAGLESARIACGDACDAIVDVRDSAEERVVTHPFVSLGIAAAVGLVLGSLLTRRCGTCRA